MRKKYPKELVPNPRRYSRKKNFKKAIACAVICLLSVTGYARNSTRTYAISLSAYSYFLPLGIHEQYISLCRRDSTEQWDGYANFTFGSVFSNTVPGCGIRYSHQPSKQWRWGLAWEYDQTHSVDSELQYCPTKDQSITLTWGTLPTNTGGLQSWFYTLGDQRILLQVQAFRMCAKYCIRLDSKWQLDLHMIRNIQSSDYLIGLSRTFRLLDQNWKAQWVWQDANHCLYGNLKWTGKQIHYILHGIYTESLGWSAGLSIEFLFPASATYSLDKL